VRQMLDAGDPAGAATETLRAVGPPALRYIRSLLRDEDDARDAFSVFSEAVWRGLPDFRGASSLRTWAFRIAHRASSRVRDEAWRQHRERLATTQASRLAEEIHSTVPRLERQRAGLERLRATLGDDDRSLLALRVDQGLSWAEIAEVLSGDETPLDANTVTKRFERLKERLARLARKEGLLE